MFACGDVASAWRPWLGACRSVGHWTSAAAGAQAVAAAITGAPAPPPEIPYAWSDAFGLRLQQVGGSPPVGAELVLDSCSDGFEASYLIGGELCCAVTGNRPQRAAAARRELAATWMQRLGETADHGLATSTTSR
jgi:3-phenylpropionate/trans-cinnamate dioxygenase ferredoxin reductase subunit